MLPNVHDHHHFERVSSGVILLDISELPLLEFLKVHECEFSARVFEINSSYGLSGWILAYGVHQGM